jgi:50S ribosomal subunit-associated GTPase HflX
LRPEEKAALARNCNGVHGVEHPSVLVSALAGEGLQALLEKIDAALPTDPTMTLSLRLPLAEGKTLALVHALGKVLHSQVVGSHIWLQAEVPASVVRKLRLVNYETKGTLLASQT